MCLKRRQDPGAGHGLVLLRLRTLGVAVPLLDNYKPALLHAGHNGLAKVNFHLLCLLPCSGAIELWNSPPAYINKLSGFSTLIISSHRELGHDGLFLGHVSGRFDGQNLHFPRYPREFFFRHTSVHLCRGPDCEGSRRDLCPRSHEAARGDD